MYSIGEFSKINRITPKTLRHYDKLGLLPPFRIDDWTGYRYYSAEQLPRIRRILFLRDLGIGLTDIARLLDGESEMDDLLRRREAEIADAMLRDGRRLEAIRRYRESLEGDEMNQDIVIKALPTVTAATMRTVVPGYDSYFDIVPKMGEYMSSVGAVCREPAYCFTIYHDGEFRESDIDVEICEAVVEPKPDSEKVKFRRVDGVDTAACLVHRGPYSSLRESYNRLYGWIDAEGWEPAGPARESYIDGIWNTESDADWRTEIQVPIRRTAS